MSAPIPRVSRRREIADARAAVEDINRSVTELSDLAVGRSDRLEGVASATAAGVVDVRMAVQDARADIAHLGGAVHELRGEMREDIAHLRGAVDELRRVADSATGMIGQMATSSGDSRLDVLRGLLARVEHYQPLFGIGGIVDTPARPSAGRARQITAALGDMDGRRVLDLGSSLGYFSMYFADRGAVATGWDFKPDNVAVARLVADVNGTGDRVTFLEREISLENVKGIHDGEHDVVLALSVLHHITASDGLDYTKKLVEELFQRVPVMVVELALKGEDASLYWDASQPEDPLEIFDGLRDELEITLLASNGTHLSTQVRPLYLVRKKACVRVASRTIAFDVERSEPYTDAPIGDARSSRRYFLSDEHVVKQYLFDDARPENWRQILSELNFFTVVLPLNEVFRAPVLVAHEVDRSVGKLAFKRTPGRLMDECGGMPESEVERVVQDVLRSLADLRSCGLHHNDVRSWNILANDEGGWLIDYGLCAAVSYDDDATALLWAAAAGLAGRRESSDIAKTDLPEAALFTSPVLLALHAAVADGQHDPRELLQITHPAGNAASTF